MREQIEKLLASDISAYRIAKDTGIAQSKISGLRSGSIKIENLTLAIAEKLVSYYEEETKMLTKESSLEKIIDLKEKIEKAKHEFPQIIIYDNKAHVTKVLRESVIEEEEDMDDLQLWIDGLIGRFDDKESIVEVDLGNGEPRYFAADEWKEIDAYTN